MLSFDVNFLTSSRRENGSPTSDELLAGFITGVPDALRTGEDSRSSLEENSEESFGGISANSGGDEVESPPRTTTVRHGAPAKKPKENCKKATAEGKDAEKPGKSYIALISMAILSVPEKKLLLGDIYKFLTDKFAYYSYCDDNAWKNSIRHNLSLNECFVKNGRADNGKGNYWSIHAACLEDFKRGDFRRRNARRRAKRSQQPLGQVPQPTASYPYNVGYVQMTQMPTGLPGAGRPTPYQRQPVDYHPYLPASTPSSMPYSQSGASLSSPVSQYSYAMSMYPSPSPTGAPPNVNAAQISEFNGWIQGHSASQLTGSPTSLAPLSAMPSDYCNIPISSYGMYGYNC